MGKHQLDEEGNFHLTRELTGTAARAENSDQVFVGDQASRERVEEVLGVYEKQSLLKFKSFTPLEEEQLTAADYDEIRRLIGEEEPAKPSTWLRMSGDKSTILAKHRRFTLEKLKSQWK